jgi:hypothetical protein
MKASGKSSDTPPPPWTWIARSMIFSATLGVAALIAAISVRACWFADGVHQPCGLEDEQADHLELDPRLGDPVADVGVLRDRLAERLALVGAGAHELERPLGDADRPHAVVDAPGAEPGLRDREAHALAGDEVGRGHANVLTWPRRTLCCR